MASFNLQWIAPEFRNRERGVSWYWMTIIIAAIMIAFAVWQKDFLFGVFVVFAEILAIIWAVRVPRPIPFVLTERSLIVAGRKEYLLSEMESFSIDPTDGSDSEFAELMFYAKGKLRQPVFVRVPQAQLEEIRKNLRLVIPEVEHQPSFIDTLEKLIGF